MASAQGKRKVLVIGASGLVGYAAMRHCAEVGSDVVCVSRRRPDETFGARFVAADLTDASQCAQLFSQMGDVTHVVYAALYEKPRLVQGWREDDQIRINEAMLRNVLEPLEAAAKGLRNVALLQGTKAYGVHVRPIPSPAREGRDELRAQPNFYWQQEDYLRAKQVGKSWSWTIFRPVLIVGYSTGSAMNVIPALGAYVALRRADGKRDLPFTGGVARVAQAVDADLLARAIDWAGESDRGANQVFNVTNGDVFTWPGVWPAIARSLGMEPGPHEPASLEATILPRETDWAALCREHGLRAPPLKEFVGLSLEYADYTMGLGRTTQGPPAIVSTVKIQQAGFHEVMDTEAMFAKWFRVFQERGLLPRP